MKYDENSESAAQHITEIVVSKILSSVGDANQGQELVEAYKSKFKTQFIG